LLLKFDEILPYNEKHVKVVDVGGFKDKKDLALPLRKSVFEFLKDNFSFISKQVKNTELIKRIVIGLGKTFNDFL